MNKYGKRGRKNRLLCIKETKKDSGMHKCVMHMGSCTRRDDAATNSGLCTASLNVRLAEGNNIVTLIWKLKRERYLNIIVFSGQNVQR